MKGKVMGKQIIKILTGINFFIALGFFALAVYESLWDPVLFVMNSIILVCYVVFLFVRFNRYKIGNK